MVARDRNGRPLAMARVVIDETVCLIEGAAATCHEARWALHDHLVRILIDRGVTHLLAEGGGTFGALGFETNVQHYQHLLGYELRHVSPSSAPPTTPRRGIVPLVPTRKRRLVASVAVAVAATASIVVPRAMASTTVPRSVAPAVRTQAHAISASAATAAIIFDSWLPCQATGERPGSSGTSRAPGIAAA